MTSPPRRPADDGRPSLSVVIVNYNARDLLLGNLAALRAGGWNDDVIVVDNASEDGSTAAIASAFPEVRVIANAANEGFPVAVNQAFDEIRGDYILLLNPDALTSGPAIAALLDRIDSEPRAGVVGPRLVYADGSPQVSAWRDLRWTDVLVEYFFLDWFARRLPGARGRDYSDRPTPDPLPVDTLSGAAILLRRSLLDRIGKLDPDLFWIEDRDFCLRVRQAGLQVIYDPTVTFVHQAGHSARKNYTISLSNQIFNKIKYLQKHGTKAEVAAVVAISFVHVLGKCVAFSLLAPFGRVYRAKARAFWYTLPRVFNPPRRLAPGSRRTIGG